MRNDRGASGRVRSHFDYRDVHATRAGGQIMLKAIVFYAAIVAILIIATIASRRSDASPARERGRLQRRLTPDDTQ